MEALLHSSLLVTLRTGLGHACNIVFVPSSLSVCIFVCSFPLRSGFVSARRYLREFVPKPFVFDFWNL